MMFGLVIQDIISALSMSDTQVGFLMGTGFVVFYAVFGIPMARWADRGNRIVIIVGAIGLWGVAVSAISLVKSFLELFLVRIFVAVGEAGCWPSAQSLISDIFPRNERVQAISRYTIYGYLGNLIYIVGGAVNQIYGWRIAFLLLGSIGFPLAFIAWALLKEPRNTNRQHMARRGANNCSTRDALMPSAVPGLREVAKVLWHNQTFIKLLTFNTLFYLFASATTWQAVYFRRSFAIATGELGAWMTALNVCAGVLGLYLGGKWFSRFAAGNERRQLKVMAVLICFICLFYILVYASHNKYLAFASLACVSLIYPPCQSAWCAIILTVVPDRMRATSLAIALLFANLFGASIGPLIVGAASDVLRPQFGNESLRYALIASSFGYIWCAWHLWCASRTVTSDVLSEELRSNVSSASLEHHGAPCD
jgi:MFS transporter, Spinster family, sphingosine-1-phosphate transporter